MPQGNPDIQQAGTFDYVIVGAGSAGCVLANRLTASGRYSVLLLEAGPADRSPWIHIPLGYGKLFGDPRHNWMFSSEPEAELDNRRIPQPRGKVLGGSSSINGLLYVRGQAEDFDTWRQLGNEGWGFDDLLPLFRRAEDQQHGADAWHGVGGPLAVSDQSEPTALCDAFIAAGQQAGWNLNPDFNGADQEGVGYYQVTARRGRRVSTAVGYLRPARSRPNLRVLTGAAATRVLFDGRRATGVSFRQGGQDWQAQAGREVILSGGAFASPQLLQVSGIGPAAWLRDQLGVPVLADLAGVGQDLQDHAQVRMSYRCTKRVTVNDAVANPWRAAHAGLRYALFRKGPLTVSAGVAGGFFRTDRARYATPDVQALLIPFSTDKMGTKLHPFPGFIASICQLRPESRGTVMAASPDMATPPLIRPNYLSTETDRRALVDGLKLLRGIVRQPAMRPWVAEELDPPPTCETDRDWLAFVRSRASTIYHPACTARMGPDGDTGAVLDPQLRVRGGLSGLRVVDAAAMPRMVSGNTNAAVIMLAEKAADLILAG